MTAKNILPPQFKKWEDCLEASKEFLDRPYMCFPVFNDDISKAIIKNRIYPDQNEVSLIEIDFEFMYMMVEKQRIEEANWFEKNSGYEKELPEPYRTWIQFYDRVKQDLKENTEIINVQFGRYYREFLLSTIEKNVISELLDDRMTYKDVHSLFNQIESHIRVTDHEQEKRFRQAKRILLTQCKKH